MSQDKKSMVETDLASTVKNTGSERGRGIPFYSTLWGRAVIFVIAAAVSVTYQTEKPFSWSIQETLVVNRNQFDSFAAATSTKWIAKFMPFVDQMQRVGKGELAKNQLYQSRKSVPFYVCFTGDVINIHKVIDYSPGRLLRLFGSSQWLRPVLTVKARQSNDKTELTVTVTFWRNSILFQMTLGPVLWLVHQDSLRRSLLLLRMDLQD
ncbi:uncharacterized protein LOC111262696 isoform X6 [Varroa jacobsoni]|uniref:uncharacterized protein LOC111262696 isoform X6 n=1 Tax=Varroa jacobsoni TaxID=62625 RepID=UPI000BF78FBD|nr:uncharacterized protein LOC111262696 isoform X6 [Varroa jacobsoni]